MSREVKSISPEAMDLLVSHRLKGNIRELKNVLERAVILGDGDTITPENLPDEIRYSQDSVTAGPTLSPGIVPLHVMITNSVQKALAATGGNKSEAARLLGITRQRLKRILRSGFSTPA